jgi:hypothetical protein
MPNLPLMPRAGQRLKCVMRYGPLLEKPETGDSLEHR